MFNRYLYVLLASALLFSCKNKADADKSFDELSEKFIAEYLSWRPSYGVYLGLHEYDGKTTDYSKASLDKELARLKSYDEQLAAFDTKSLSEKKYYDWRVLSAAVKNEIFYFEDLQSYTKNPMVYAGAVDVNIYIKRDFAPLEERVQSIIAIEKKAGEIYAAAKANLLDSLSRPHTQLAIDIARGTADFLKKMYCLH
jgi:uncharacterized protein (DUF885 family)